MEYYYFVKNLANLTLTLILLHSVSYGKLNLKNKNPWKNQSPGIVLCRTRRHLYHLFRANAVSGPRQELADTSGRARFDAVLCPHVGLFLDDSHSKHCHNQIFDAEGQYF